MATILVIDDEDAIRAVISRLLASWGFRTVDAADGSAAIHLLAEHSSQLIAATVDLDMPTTNGTETIAMLAEYAPKLPVVVVTAWTFEELRGRTPGRRGLGYVSKPFKSEQLLSEIWRVIGEMKSA